MFSRSDPLSMFSSSDASSVNERLENLESIAITKSSRPV
jgi:hypothetical protein